MRVNNTMKIYDIVSKKIVEDLPASAKFQIKKTGKYLHRYVILDQFHKIVKTLIDEDGKEYHCTSQSSLKYYFNDPNVARKFSALFHKRVLTRKYNGKVYKIKEFDKSEIQEKIQRNQATPLAKKKRYNNWINKKDNRLNKNKQSQKWKKNNKNHMKDYNREYFKNRRSTDLEFKIKTNLRSRVRAALKGVYKENKTIDFLGCSVYSLKNHLESLFQKGMSWDNYGNPNGDHSDCWHIDHIQPCSSFDLTDPEEQKKCFHYTNLQPLWGIDNIKKRDR